MYHLGEKRMNKEILEIDKFNIISDEENYYFFRALNMADNRDIEQETTISSDGKIERIRTDRERYEGKTKYTDIDYSNMEEVFVLYGKETKGLPEWLLEKYLNAKTIRIPMLPTLRSLNLSNSVAIITYEILRQKNFEDLQEVSNYFDE